MMMRGLVLFLTIASFIAVGGLAANGQTNEETMGTTQMAGQWADIGKEYTLGDTTGDPMNFALNSAEFIATRVKIGEKVFFPKADEKFLVLHYTIHNPQDVEVGVVWNAFYFTAVDATNRTRESDQEVGQEENSQPLDVRLEPAQEIKAYTYIVVPAKGVIPKLIVKRGEGPVLRYDLKDKVTPLAAPYADPSDTSGCSVLGQVPGEMGTFYPTGTFDIKLDSAAYTDQTYQDFELEDGTHTLVLNVTIRNATGETQPLGWTMFAPDVKTSAGENIEYNQYMIHSTRDEVLEAQLDPGQEIKARFFFAVHMDDPAAKFIAREGTKDEGSRTFAFDLTDVK